MLHASYSYCYYCTHTHISIPAWMMSHCRLLSLAGHLLISFLLACLPHGTTLSLPMCASVTLLRPLPSHTATVVCSSFLSFFRITTPPSLLSNSPAVPSSTPSDSSHSYTAPPPPQTPPDSATSPPKCAPSPQATPQPPPQSPTPAAASP